MTDPIEGQDEILKYGTAIGEEPLIDTLASLARTALSDPAGLPEGHGDETDEPQIDYALDCLDSLIDGLNPSTETSANLARSVRILGRQLAERADALRAVDAEGDDYHRYQRAAERLDAGLDLIDEALEALEPS